MNSPCFIKTPWQLQRLWTLKHFDSSTDLPLLDVALDSYISPTSIHITLKQSKNDQFRTGTTICLGKTIHAVCPVDALMHYLAIQGDTSGPLFLVSNNQSLTRASFRASLKNLFKNYTWTIASLICTGVATSAKRAGVSNSYLKALGRWKSDAYLKYVQLSLKDLARSSKSHLINLDLLLLQFPNLTDYINLDQLFISVVR